MAIKKTWLSILITIVITTNIFSTCKKDNCISNAYFLKEKWTILPTIEIVSVGDTIIFESKISTTPFDYNTNSNVNFIGNALINSTFVVYVLNSNFTNPSAAVDSFNFINNIGKVETNTSTSPKSKNKFFMKR